MKWIMRIIKKIRFAMKCADADWGYKYMYIVETPYPPSFFLKHGPEEARRIIHEHMEECRRLLETLDEEDK